MAGWTERTPGHASSLAPSSEIRLSDLARDSPRHPDAQHSLRHATSDPEADNDETVLSSRTPQSSSLLPTLSTLCYLVFFSIFGTLARLGLQWLTFYPGAPIVESALWANVVGSLFMGFLVQLAAPSPLQIGLTTGFCGSLTSFSSFERDVFLALANRLSASSYHAFDSANTSASFGSATSRNGGYSFMALLAVIISTMGLCIAAVHVGRHFAILTNFASRTRIHGKYHVHGTINKLVLFIGPACWLGAVFLSIFPPSRTWRGEVLFALVFAPLGCLLRYHISRLLNSRHAWFPSGTFAVNMVGCAVLAMCYDLQHVSSASSPKSGIASSVGGGVVACQVLQGVMDGFCGCLTTVSTFVIELTNRKEKGHAWIYGGTSVFTGLAIMVLVMGSVLWTRGYSEPACVTMRTDL